MEKNKIERIKYFLSNSKSPLFVNFIPEDIFSDEYVTVIHANCSNEELNGNNTDNKPKWFNKLKNSSILVIDLINASIEEQKRFIPIVKDRAYQNFTIPDSCKILLLSKKNNIDDNELVSYAIRI